MRINLLLTYIGHYEMIIILFFTLIIFLLCILWHFRQHFICGWCNGRSRSMSIMSRSVSAKSKTRNQTEIEDILFRMHVCDYVFCHDYVIIYVAMTYLVIFKSG